MEHPFPIEITCAITYELIPEEKLYILNDINYNIDSLRQYFSSGLKIDPFKRIPVSDDEINIIMDNFNVMGTVIGNNNDTNESVRQRIRRENDEIRRLRRNDASRIRQNEYVAQMLRILQESNKREKAFRHQQYVNKFSKK